MRDYDAHADELEAAGGRLVVLTNDSEQVLREVVPEKNLGSTFVHVGPETWADWGLQNDRRAEIPYPTTFIVAPDGTLVYREIHVNHTLRAHVSKTIARVAAWNQPITAAPQPVPDPAPEHAEPVEPDWDNAVKVAAAVSEGQLVVQLVVGPGFHVYGANETVSRPLVATVDQLPDLEIPIPTGDEKDLSEAMGSAWVLEGSVRLSTALPADAPAELSGVLDYQVCTDNTCTAPTSTTWRASIEDER